MSLAFNHKSGEVEGDGWTLMDTNRVSKYVWGSRSSVCWIGAAAVCIGLLLLTVILVGHNTGAINKWEAKSNNMISEITQDREKLQCSNLTDGMKVLQSHYDAMVESLEKLQGEIYKLNISSVDKPCQAGWIKFSYKCYYVSPQGTSKTWEDSRKSCQAMGADLVIINSRAELEFVKRSYSVTWIGLSRADGLKWKWVDGTWMDDIGFWQEDEPNNADGNENCVEVSHSSGLWNDVPCDRLFSWVCEA